MKVRLAIFFLSLGICLPGFTQNQVALSRDRLLSGDWSKTDFFGMSLVFSEDGAFRANYDDMSSGFVLHGAYKVKNGKLDLFKIAEGTGELEDWALGSVLIRDGNAIQYPEWLEIRASDMSWKVEDRSRINPPGKKVRIEGRDCVLVGGVEATLSSNLKFRQSPSLGGKIIEVEVGPDSGGKVTVLPYVPSGWTVKAWARTEKKEKVESWNAYWYYVEMDIFVGPPSPAKGWMYGEFLRLAE